MGAGTPGRDSPLLSAPLTESRAPGKAHRPPARAHASRAPPVAVAPAATPLPPGPGALPSPAAPVLRPRPVEHSDQPLAPPPPRLHFKRGPSVTYCSPAPSSLPRPARRATPSPLPSARPGGGGRQRPGHGRPTHNKRQIPSPCRLISARKSPRPLRGGGGGGGEIRGYIFTSPRSYRLVQRRGSRAARGGEGRRGVSPRPPLPEPRVEITFRRREGGRRRRGPGFVRLTRLAAYLRRTDGTSRLRGPAGAGGAGRRRASGRLRYQRGPDGGRRMHGGSGSGSGAGAGARPGAARGPGGGRARHEERRHLRAAHRVRGRRLPGRPGLPPARPTPGRRPGRLWPWKLPRNLPGTRTLPDTQGSAALAPLRSLT